MREVLKQLVSYTLDKLHEDSYIVNVPSTTSPLCLFPPSDALLSLSSSYLFLVACLKGDVAALGSVETGLGSGELNSLVI